MGVLALRSVQTTPVSPLDAHLSLYLPFSQSFSSLSPPPPPPPFFRWELQYVTAGRQLGCFAARPENAPRALKVGAALCPHPTTLAMVAGTIRWHWLFVCCSSIGPPLQMVPRRVRIDAVHFVPRGPGVGLPLTPLLVLLRPLCACCACRLCEQRRPP